MALSQPIHETPDVDVQTTLTEAGRHVVFATAAVRSASDPARAAALAYAPIARTLRERKLAIVHERVFGSLGAEPVVLAARQRALGECAGPGAPTYIEGAPPWGSGLSGVLLQAAPRDRVQVLQRSVARSVSRRWSVDGDAHVVVQGIDGLDPSPGADNGREAQFRRVFERAFGALAAEGIGPGGLVRTWFYVDGIGESYALFNHARHAAFSAAGLLGPGLEAGALPASTAIGCANSRGAAVVLDLVAVDGGSTGSLEGIASPVQPEALSYGAAFARARRLRRGGLDMVHLSGTAAIGPRGETLSPSDAEAQIRTTLAAVRRLLRECGTDLSQAVAATAFVKRATDAPLFERALRALGTPLGACVPVVADVCRDDLLFELDAEVALRAGTDVS